MSGTANGCRGWNGGHTEDLTEPPRVLYEVEGYPGFQLEAIQARYSFYCLSYVTPDHLRTPQTFVIEHEAIDGPPEIIHVGTLALYDLTRPYLAERFISVTGSARVQLKDDLHPYLALVAGWEQGKPFQPRLANFEPGLPIAAPDRLREVWQAIQPTIEAMRRRSGRHSKYSLEAQAEILARARKLKPGRTWEQVGAIVNVPGSTLWRWDQDEKSRKKAEL